MLHKTTKIIGFHLVTTDGEAGHVDDFLLDERGSIRYLVVDTSNLPGGKAVVIPASAVQAIDSPNRKIHVQMRRDEVHHSPPVDSIGIELIETLPPTLM